MSNATQLYKAWLTEPTHPEFLREYADELSALMTEKAEGFVLGNEDRDQKASHVFGFYPRHKNADVHQQFAFVHITIEFLKATIDVCAAKYERSELLNNWQDYLNDGVWHLEQRLNQIELAVNFLDELEYLYGKYKEDVHKSNLVRETAKSYLRFNGYGPLYYPSHIVLDKMVTTSGTYAMTAYVMDYEKRNEFVASAGELHRELYATQSYYERKFK